VVDGGQSCASELDRKLHYPWFGVYPTCIYRGSNQFLKYVCDADDDTLPKPNSKDKSLERLWSNTPGFPMIQSSVINGK
jgi:hypothetical protein